MISPLYVDSRYSMFKSKVVRQKASHNSYYEEMGCVHFEYFLNDDKNVGIWALDSTSLLQKNV